MAPHSVFAIGVFHLMDGAFNNRGALRQAHQPQAPSAEPQNQPAAPQDHPLAIVVHNPIAAIHHSPAISVELYHRAARSPRFHSLPPLSV